MLTSSSVTPYNPHNGPCDYYQPATDRQTIVYAARKSGLTNIPDPVLGAYGNLLRPATSVIEDTQPIRTPAANSLSPKRTKQLRTIRCWSW